MTNEELKKKLVEIIINAIWKDAQADYDSTDESEARTIADALIAAGFVDKSDYASMNETAVKYKAEVSKAENRAKEAEHRAEVAQLIAERACELVFSEEINDEDWVSVIFNYKKRKVFEKLVLRQIFFTTT